MYCLAIFSLAVLVCYSAGALVAPVVQAAHAGYCPMHAVMCAIYCPPTSLLSMAPRQVGGCTRDNECVADEKCCRPACGCTNRCAKASVQSGFGKFPTL